MKPLVVAKVGGSLFDLPDLRVRLLTFIASCDKERLVLVAGGGAGADVIRQLDATHRLGEERAHELAMSVLAVNARFLSAVLGIGIVQRLYERPEPFVLDPYAFFCTDQAGSNPLQHSWQVTSDSIAARVAGIGQGRLVLLKSVDLEEGTSWEDASEAGLVDAAFPDIVNRSGLKVSWMNLRMQAQGGYPADH